jgi:RNA-directed DNA polymerase
MRWRLRSPRAPLYEQVCEIETLTRAYRHVRRGGGAGVDGLTVAVFEARWAEHMAELTAELRERRYHPLPLRQFLLPRADGRQRPISLLALRDRIVQRAVLEVVQPRFEQVTAASAFGVLPGRGVGEAIARAEQARHDGLPWIVRADIRGFFEEVEHRRVVATFRAITADDLLAELVAEWLAVAGLQRPVLPAAPQSAPPRHEDLVGQVRGGLQLVRSLYDVAASELSGLEFARPVATGLAARLGTTVASWQPRHRGAAPLAVGIGALGLATGVTAAARRYVAAGREASAARGTPQGSPLSPLLACAVLSDVDQALDRSERVLVRYVDDMLLVCRDERTAQQALVTARRELARVGLALNEAKTLVQPYDAGFTFLGVELPQLPSPEPRRAAVRALVDAFRGTGYWRTRQIAKRARRRVPSPWGRRP